MAWLHRKPNGSTNASSAAADDVDDPTDDVPDQHNIPMRDLVTACGIDVDAATQLDDTQRVQQMSTIIPEIQWFLPLLTQLPLDDRRAILAHAERRIQLHKS